MPLQCLKRKTFGSVFIRSLLVVRRLRYYNQNESDAKKTKLTTTHRMESPYKHSGQQQNLGHSSKSSPLFGVFQAIVEIFEKKCLVCHLAGPLGLTPSRNTRHEWWKTDISLGCVSRPAGAHLNSRLSVNLYVIAIMSKTGVLIRSRVASLETVHRSLSSAGSCFCRTAATAEVMAAMREHSRLLSNTEIPRVTTLEVRKK